MRTYRIEPAGLTDIGHVRSANENHLITEGDLLAVADGMGGLGHGEAASRTAIEALREAFGADPTANDLVQGVAAANTRGAPTGRGPRSAGR